MAASLGHVLAQIHGWTSPRLSELSDAVLLERFVQHRDEPAFAALVARHGPMVLRSCYRVLGDGNEAEDAFQATFLILARRAHSLRKPDALPGFLHSIARRTALKARTKRAIRASQTAFPEDLPDAHPDPLAQLTARELLTVLDEEVARLPREQRSAFVLCCLEGHTQEEAARMLGWTVGSIKGRLERARRRLQARLQRRGIALSAALALIVLARDRVMAHVPALLLQGTVRAVLHGGIGSTASALSHGVLQAMFWPKFASALVVSLALVLAAVSTAALVYRDPLAEAPEDKSPAVPFVTTNVKVSSQILRTDVWGDPLPPRAVARLGALRLYHGRSVHRVILSTDGKQVVSSSSDGNRLWDAATGQELPLRNEFRQAAIFATRDKLIAVEKTNLNLQLWDVAAGKKIGGLLPSAKLGQTPVAIHLGFPDGYSTIALAPDGRTLIVSNLGNVGAGVQQVLRFCDVFKGKVEEPVALKGSGGMQSRMVFSTNSKTLVVQCDDSTIHFWDVDSRTEKLVSRPDSDLYGGYIALSPDGTILATAPYGKGVRLWDTGTLKELPPLLKQPDVPNEPAKAVSFSSDGKQLASINWNSPIVHLWNLATRKEVCRFHSNESHIWPAAFSTDSKYLVVCDGPGITFWDLATGKVRHDFGHTYFISSLCFSPDGRRLVTAATYTDKVIRIWDPLTGELKAKLLGHTWGTEKVEYAPDGKWIVSGSQDGTVRFWDAATGKEIRRLETKDGRVGPMVLSPDGKTLATGGEKTIQLWDTATGRRLASFDKTGWRTYLAFSLEGKSLATSARSDKDVRFRDVSTGEPIRQPLGRTSGLAIDPAGNTFAVGGKDGTVVLYDLISGEELRRLSLRDEEKKDNKNPLMAFAFSPDGRTLAVGYRDDMVRVWELCSGRERARFEGHRGDITALAFSPDGRLLASGGDDRTIMVWDVTGQQTTHLPDKGRLRPEEGEVLWGDMADSDAAKAYRAMQTLVAAKGQAVSILKERIRSAVASELRIDDLLADLDSDRFEVRERAERGIRKRGEDAEPALRKLLGDKPSVEQRLRVKRLLGEIASGRSTESLRGARAVEVLERIGSADAQQVLKMLAEGDPQARLTRDATAALQRLSKVEH